MASTDSLQVDSLLAKYQGFDTGHFIRNLLVDPVSEKQLGYFRSSPRTLRRH